MPDLTTAQQLSAYYDELVEAGFNADAASQMTLRAGPTDLPTVKIKAVRNGAKPAPREPAEPEPEAKQPCRPDTAIYGILFGVRVRLEWPDGPPVGLDRRKVTEKLAQLEGD